MIHFVNTVQGDWLNCSQRLCLRSGAISKPRPVPDTKR